MDYRLTYSCSYCNTSRTVVKPEQLNLINFIRGAPGWIHCDMPGCTGVRILVRD